MSQNNRVNSDKAPTHDRLVSLRDFPLEFSSMVAISTDIDDTDLHSLAKVHSCFYGLEPDYEGIGLELANSYWMVNTEDPIDCRIYLFDDNLNEHANTKRLAEFFKSELFDTLHTYGQFMGAPFRRFQAQRSIDKMAEFDLKPRFWTYHGDRAQAQNIRPDDEDWLGDKPDSSAYHLDLLAKSNVTYVRLPPSQDLLEDTPVLGATKFRDGTKLQTVTGRSLIFEPEHPERIRAWVNRLSHLGRLSYEKTRIIQGSQKHPNKVQTWKPEMLPYQFSKDILDAYVEKRHAALIVQHISQNHCVRNFAMPELRNALRRLSDYQAKGKILVTTSVRMLDYLRARDGMTFTQEGGQEGEPLTIKIEKATRIEGVTSALRPRDLEGIEFVIDKSMLAGGMPRVLLGEREIPEFIVSRLSTDSDHLVLRYPWRSQLDTQRMLIGEWKRAFGIS